MFHVAWETNFSIYFLFFRQNSPGLIFSNITGKTSIAFLLFSQNLAFYKNVGVDNLKFRNSDFDAMHGNGKLLFKSL